MAEEAEETKLELHLFYTNRAEAYLRVEAFDEVRRRHGRWLREVVGGVEAGPDQAGRKD